MCSVKAAQAKGRHKVTPQECSSEDSPLLWTWNADARNSRRVLAGRVREKCRGECCALGEKLKKKKKKTKKKDNKRFV